MDHNGAHAESPGTRGDRALDARDQSSEMAEDMRNGQEGHGEGDLPGHFVPLSNIRPAEPKGLDFAAIREKLASSRGRQYWRSLDEVAETPEFQAYLQKEFPMQAPREMLPLGRREFLRVMGATLALAGVGGCAYQPAEKIVPYVEQPEEIVPGKPLYYSTSYVRSGYATGLVGETHMGRPIKLEGNAQHPASLGSTDAFAQAALLNLYDPDRSQSARYLGGPASWAGFLGQLSNWLPQLRARQGAGLRILVGTVTSPTLEAQLRRLQNRFPQARIHQYEPVSRESARAGAQMAFGRPVNAVYRFDRAQRILSLDSDFLLEEPGSVRYARDFIKGRLVRDGQTEMNRLYVVESTPTITGSKADHALRVRPSQVEAVARAIANGLGIAGAGSATPPEGVTPEWIQAVVQDLQSHRGTALVVPGVTQPPVVHALAHAINGALGAAGKTVTYTAPVEVAFDNPATSLKKLADDIQAGQVEALFILGANPVYTAPAGVDFAAALKTLNGQDSGVLQGQKKLTVHLGLYDDETGVQCQWHLPASHFLEAWGDARAYDGTVSIIQPLIRPLYDSRSLHELLSAVIDPEPRDGYAIVREQWMGRNPAYFRRAAAQPGVAPGGPTGAASQPAMQPTRAFERYWHQVLTTGIVPNTAAPAATVTAGGNFATPPAAAPEGLELVFRPDPTIWDGEFSNNGWQQEVPKPLNSLTWDNAALISTRTAEAQNLRNRDLVEITANGQTVRAAVWIQPGQPDNVISLSLGYGRTRIGRIGNQMGFNAYPLRAADAPGFATGVTLRKPGGTYDLVTAQQYFSMFGRDIVRVGTLEEWRADPKKPHFMHAAGEHGGSGEHPTLYPQMWPSDRQHAEGEGNPGVWEPKMGRAYSKEGIPAWGMVIDQNACIGCNACTIACQAENNIATVGKDQVKMHRFMHWIRIDNYHTGPVEDPDTVFQPVPCMHCEKAPCEPVCPVEATSHSAEGINEMTYNRCIGTRYCSNNCPYKVRRFNFFQYSDQQTPQIQLMRNPDVTVRSRGVMEKCTYCIQRINWARIEAEKEERPIADGEVVTACAQACPTQAIIFGDINDQRSNGGKGSRVRQLKSGSLNYGLLTELNTQPRTTYLPAMRNPNPVIEPQAHGTPAGGGGGAHGPTGGTENPPAHSDEVPGTGQGSGTNEGH